MPFLDHGHLESFSLYPIQPFSPSLSLTPSLPLSLFPSIPACRHPPFLVSPIHRLPLSLSHPPTYPPRLRLALLRLSLLLLRRPPSLLRVPSSFLTLLSSLTPPLPLFSLTPSRSCLPSPFLSCLHLSSLTLSILPFLFSLTLSPLLSYASLTPFLSFLTPCLSFLTLSRAFPFLSHASLTPSLSSLTPFLPASPLLRPSLSSLLLSYAFLLLHTLIPYILPARCSFSKLLSCTPCSFFATAPLAQALIVYLFKWVKEWRGGREVDTPRKLHMTRLSQVPQHILDAATNSGS